MLDWRTCKDVTITKKKGVEVKQAPATYPASCTAACYIARSHADGITTPNYLQVIHPCIHSIKYPCIIHASIHASSIHPSTHPSNKVSMHPSNKVSMHPSMQPSILSIHASIHPCIHPSVRLCMHSFTCVCLQSKQSAFFIDHLCKIFATHRQVSFALKRFC